MFRKNEKLAVTLLRCAVGWHFLYEGVTKILADQWTARGFLANAQGPLSELYHGMAASDAVMAVVDPLNMYGLTLIGLALFTGIGIRIAAASGIALLALYYLAYPPFGGTAMEGLEGALYLVNRNAVEALALVLLLAVREKGYGLHGLVALLKQRKKTESEEGSAASRREALKHIAVLPVLGVMGYGASREKREGGVDGFSGATLKLEVPPIDKLAGELPKGKIKNFELSRLVMGGNMIGGWAHSRDLLYVPSLSLAYNTEKKIFETLMLAEEAGIDSINIGFPSNPVLQKYRKESGSKMTVISQVAPVGDDIFKQVNMAMDAGADILQIQGNWVDWLSRDGKFDVIHAIMDKIRSGGYVAGLGAHTVDSLILCEEQGIIPDYYMKTMHHDRYWSAHPIENRVPFEVDGERFPDHNRFHDNMFCLFPEKDVAFVEKTTVPVMAYKVLAAGAIHPQDGFRWALQNGADFLCVGMFDFQVVTNTNIMINTLNTLRDRKREWYG